MCPFCNASDVAERPPMLHATKIAHTTTPRWHKPWRGWFCRVCKRVFRGERGT